MCGLFGALLVGAVIGSNCSCKKNCCENRCVQRDRCNCKNRYYCKCYCEPKC